MNKKTTQCDRILEYMQNYGEISPIIALEEIGCFRLTSRIWDLKCKGIEIESKMHNYKNKFGENKCYKIYWLKSEMHNGN